MDQLLGERMNRASERECVRAQERIELFGTPEKGTGSKRMRSLFRKGRTFYQVCIAEAHEKGWTWKACNRPFRSSSFCCFELPHRNQGGRRLRLPRSSFSFRCS